MKIFLSLKHFFIFTLIFIISPLTPFILNKISPPQSNNITVWLNWCLDFIQIIALFLWLWSMGKFLQEKSNFKLDLNLFYFALFVPFLNFLLKLFIFVSMVIYKEAFTLSSTFIQIFPIISVSLSIFSIIYSSYFVAKSLKMVEQRAIPNLNSFIVEILCLIFPFIGVWIIQPRINQIFSNE